MGDILTNGSASSHLLISDMRPEMAKAGLSDVRKTDQDDAEWRAAVGGVVRTVRGARLLKEFAAVIKRDERQVSRWEEGKERPHLDALFAVECLRQPLIVALAELAGHGVELETTIRIRRPA